MDNWKTQKWIWEVNPVRFLYCWWFLPVSSMASWYGIRNEQAQWSGVICAVNRTVSLYVDYNPAPLLLPLNITFLKLDLVMVSGLRYHTYAGDEVAIMPACPTLVRASMFLQGSPHAHSVQYVHNNCRHCWTLGPHSGILHSHIYLKWTQLENQMYPSLL